MGVPTRDEIDPALRFVEEQTQALVSAAAQGWHQDAIESIENERDAVAAELRTYGYDADVQSAIERGERGDVNERSGNKKKPSRKKASKKKGKKRSKTTYALDWTPHTEIPNVELHSAQLVGDMRIVVGRPKGEKWRIGYWTDDQGFIFYDKEFDSLTQAKKQADEEGQELLRMASEIQILAPRMANREVGDVVLAARQYQRATEDEMAAMDRGTPEQLSAATKRKKEAKEALEDMTGANRELIGAMGGAAIGAALGGLINPLGAAIGALAAGAIGSVVARPSLPDAPVPERAPRGRTERDRDVLHFPRRPSDGRPRAANRRSPR